MRHVTQPDEHTCGPASVTWALRKLGFRGIRFREIEDELHVKEVPFLIRQLARLFGIRDRETLYGSLPPAVIKVMLKHGARPILPSLKSEYLSLVEEKKGVALGLFQTRCGAWHWIGIQVVNGQVFVMDPLRTKTSRGRQARQNEFWRSRHSYLLGFRR